MLDTTRETSCHYVLWGEEKQEACGAQDDVTFLPSTKHYASVFSAVLTLLVLC